MRYLLAKIGKVEDSCPSVIIYSSFHNDKEKRPNFGDYITSGFYFVPVISNDKDPEPIAAIVLTVYNAQKGWSNKIIGLYTNSITAAKDYKKLKEKYNDGYEAMWNFSETKHWLFELKLTKRIHYT